MCPILLVAGGSLVRDGFWCGLGRARRIRHCYRVRPAVCPFMTCSSNKEQRCLQNHRWQQFIRHMAPSNTEARCQAIKDVIVCRFWTLSLWIFEFHFGKTLKEIIIHYPLCWHLIDIVQMYHYTFNLANASSHSVLHLSPYILSICGPPVGIELLTLAVLMPCSTS